MVVAVCELVRARIARIAPITGKLPRVSNECVCVCLYVFGSENINIDSKNIIMSVLHIRWPRIWYRRLVFRIILQASRHYAEGIFCLHAVDNYSNQLTRYSVSLIEHCVWCTKHQSCLRSKTQKGSTQEWRTRLGVADVAESETKNDLEIGKNFDDR